MSGRKVKIYLVEEGQPQVEISSDFDSDTNVSRFRFKENRVEIGFGTFEQFEDGSLSLDLMLAGDYTLRSNNVAGMAHLDGYINAALRKN